MAIILGVIFWLGIFITFSTPVKAVSVAGQTQYWGDELAVWQVIQELGTDLSGTVESFTFRISTSNYSKDKQFDYTAQNTRIWDKTTKTYISGCISPGSTGRLNGLIFSTVNVPSGYEDVTVDFSCRNYNFIPGHRYLVLITNANLPQYGGYTMRLAGAVYTGTTNDYFTGGGARYANGNPWDWNHGSGFCHPEDYIWGDTNPNPYSGCRIWTTTKDDLYFILNNNSPPPPPPRLSVIFIPGIGGSELKATQDIFIFSHAYAGNEKIWVNQDEAAKLGSDDYFDVLKLKADGQTPEADLSLTGNLTSFGYGDIDSFFTGMGYIKNTNFFIFPYDWRKDIRGNKDNLDTLIETAKGASGQSQVNIVAHSMGGLIARLYISDPSKAAKVNKLIELGVPHLGAPSATKALMYGEPVGRWYFKIINIGVNGNEVKDVLQNFPSHHSLLPSTKYYDFYDSSFRDDRDIDSNNVTGNLTYNQTKNLLSNLNYNMTVFNFGEEFHNNLDPILNQTNGAKIYEIVGTAQPTLGQIHETWWITWPVNLISKTDQIFINGDDTVPLYSASLKNDSLDISGATNIYYVEQKHSDLVSSSGTAMQTVKAILNDDNSLPVEVKSEKIVLEGEQISLDEGELDLLDDQNRHCGLDSNGEMEENIPDIICTTSGNTKHAFVKKKAAKVKVKATRKTKATSSKTTTVKKRTYRQDKISKTIIYKDLTIDENSRIEFDLDPSLDTTPSLTYYADEEATGDTTILPTAEITGDTASDQTPPVTAYQTSGTNPVTITLTGSDTGSGILRIEYSLDNGQTVQTYTGPFTISTPGETIIQFHSIDNLGNEENPQTITIKIAAPTPTPTPTSTPTPIPSSNSSSGSSSSSSDTVSITSISVSSPDKTLQSAPAVLGVSFKNPSHISDQINVDNILGKQTSSKSVTLGGLLWVSGGIIILASFGLLLTLFKPSPE